MSGLINNSLPVLNNNFNPNSLPPPVFVTDQVGLDPNAVLLDMISTFETTTGRTLAPAQVERLLINLYAYRESLVRAAIQWAGQQTLLAFADFPAIDYIGQLLETDRLVASYSVTTLQFTLKQVLNVSLTIPGGTTQVQTYDGQFIFTTNESIIIPAGSLYGAVEATCTTAGVAANGYIEGQVNNLLSLNTQIASVLNTTTTSGGADVETTTAYRNRLQQAPNKLAVAGPAGAYKYLTLSVSPSIVDVQVLTSAPGVVQLYVLTGPVVSQPAPSPNTVGIPGATLLANILTYLSGDMVRPLTDTINVNAVTEVDYTITAMITVYGSAVLTQVESAVSASAVQLAINLAQKIQQNIVPSQWVAALSVSGVYEAVVTIVANINGTPVTNQTDGSVLLLPGQWSNCTAISLSYQLYVPTV